jgi:hypothetical protein
MKDLYSNGREGNQTEKDTMKVGDSSFKEGSRAEQVRKKGLCVTYTNNTHCTFLDNLINPVLQSDELGKSR